MAAAEVRKATEADLPAIATALARAFEDDPVVGWLFAKPEKRSRGVERMFTVRLRQLIAQEQVYTTNDRAGAAIWALPGRWHVTLRETIELGRLVLNPRLPVLMSGLQRVDGAHPRQPRHFYLAVLGVDPPRQGGGLGTALLRPVLELCDAEGLPAYLESSKERNVDFYARHGFRVTRELQLPKGPPLWPMWREPARSGV
jgi:ribosomal protein S18 acetylase RimI-like enzyme